MPPFMNPPDYYDRGLGEGGYPEGGDYQDKYEQYVRCLVCGSSDLEWNEAFKPKPILWRFCRECFTVEIL